MEIELSQRAIADIEKWKKSGNKKVQEKITALTTSILSTPFEGIGKPSRLSIKWLACGPGA
ncbi:MAG: type II toxin-antitoxin system YoeB family toxin [Mucilaginibacter sp.]